MQKKWAISWLFAATIILLLHTLVPHSHDFTTSQPEPTTCEHHQHGFWEFVEHLLDQNCGEDHLEHYQVSLKKDLDIDNDNSLITNILPQFTTQNQLLLINKIFPKTDYYFKKSFLLKSLTFRGPPFV